MHSTTVFKYEDLRVISVAWFFFTSKSKACAFLMTFSLILYTPVRFVHVFAFQVNSNFDWKIFQVFNRFAISWLLTRLSDSGIYPWLYLFIYWKDCWRTRKAGNEQSVVLQDKSGKVPGQIIFAWPKKHRFLLDFWSSQAFRWLAGLVTPALWRLNRNSDREKASVLRKPSGQKSQPKIFNQGLTRVLPG